VKAKTALIVPVLLVLARPVYAEEVTIPMCLTAPDGVGQAVGEIRAKDTPNGLQLMPDLRGLPPGPHGFHAHENPNCGAKVQDGKPVPGLAAGGHYDPDKTGAHHGPTGKGHRGDLPLLRVDADGTATSPVIAPHLSVKDLKGRSLMIHEGGDNYSDKPKPLGGGGARIACGVVGAG